ncbi:disintegrin and metalloproteinase domain-containing protein unc-71-like [Oppia nitens]|uniref:disintegrin and metalloproteinase domain-containing protein unc-71-like n=1 Tax=Oppia nitens TaxID=1686743 RepID=UPI0023DC3773|nr:disintegrin and metalloproteinase domain-containing protein unc-71-like [Oppia nitens]
MCGNSRMHEWGFKQYRRRPPAVATKPKRDVRAVEKYVELALILDKDMFDARNMSRTDVVNDALQIINCVDVYFRLINTRVSVVYVETWAYGNQIDVNDNVRQTLLNFMEYASKKLYKVHADATHLLLGKPFSGGEVGMAVPDTICTAKAVAISIDSSIYEPHLVASTVTHMLGHNIGMGHDEDSKDDKSSCKCNDWWGCIMAKNILGEDRVQPYHFSQCSVEEYNNALQMGHGICLLNKPNQLEDFKSCGNAIVEEDEDCDCGSFHDCLERDPCCDPITCKLKQEAECSSGPCCVNCKLKPLGHVCRLSNDECDLPEVCDGKSGTCPPDIYKKNGNSCKDGKGFCFHGECPTLDNQCSVIWGKGSRASELICFQQFNAQGNARGNCGQDTNGIHLKCTQENLMCGSLQCQFGNQSPFTKGMDKEYSRTIVVKEKVEYECKVATGSIRADIENMGLIQDGTKCADHKICVNQSCTSIDFFIEPGDCPTSDVKITCSGHGDCSNINTCVCYQNWMGVDCSQESNYVMTTDEPIIDNQTTIVTNPTQNPSNSESYSTENTIKEYENRKKSLGAPYLVMILVSIVGGVFIFFALLAMCYRRQSLKPSKSERQLKKQLNNRKFSANNESDAYNDANVSRIITFGSMPSYREDKMQEMKRQKDSMRSDSQTDLDSHNRLMNDTSQFIELSPNNLSKITHHLTGPEKGILKHIAAGTATQSEVNHLKERWSELSHSDNNESQSDNNRNSDAFSDMERLKGLGNGYHDDMLEALQSSSGRSIDLVRHQSPSSDAAKKAFLDSIPEYGGLGHLKADSQVSGSDEDSVPPIGPIRIRNLEDLLRQLEKQSLQNTGLSPSGSDDIRMSEPESDRHLYSSSGGRGSHMPSAHTSYHSSALSALESHLVEQDLAYLLGAHHRQSDHLMAGIPPPPPPPQQSSTSRSSILIGTGSLCPYTKKIQQMQPPSPSTTTSTTTSTVHDNNRDEDENGSVLDTDLSGDAAFYGSGVCQPMLRSASEEALPVSLSCDFTVSGQLSLKTKETLRLSSDSYNGFPSNQVFTTSVVLPPHCPESSVAAGRAAATAIAATTIARTDPLPETPLSSDPQPDTASTAADGQQLLHTSSPLDRKSPKTISRFTVTLVTKDSIHESTTDDQSPQKEKHLHKKAKKKSKKKFPEYKV